MKLISKVAIGIVIYLIFMVVLFPARIAAALAPLPAGIKLSGVSGSLWNGQAQLVNIGPRQLEQLQWQLSPWALLTGTVKAQIQIGSRASAVNGKGLVSWSAKGVSAKNLRLDAPIGFLVGGSKLPLHTVLSGDISLNLDIAEQGLPWCAALNGKLFLNQFDLKNQFGDYPLGNIEFGLQCVQGQLQLATDDEKNTIGVAGTVLLKDKMQMEVNGRMRRTDSQSQDLQQSLVLLGKPDASGNYPIKYNGRIPGM
ncbi:type II secretion system protein N [Shewanella yunxiaonensis]|uniref:Type II secretion system protein N n=1 Tax=Shewanella yunxiaonensis TaxID=2829809 RepID=A0ABX7YTP6_9GAMM|nr:MULTISPECIES: type II secretion system protein N [Shewanella]MDF0534567.1 type II secretion system protein N [Shewanella sp. A32]QUN06052.1 type II secretion system protein N [Shewanella yunxiaonensis]